MDLYTKFLDEELKSKESFGYPKFDSDLIITKSLLVNRVHNPYRYITKEWWGVYDRT